MVRLFGGLAVLLLLTGCMVSASDVAMAPEARAKPAPRAAAEEKWVMPHPEREFVGVIKKAPHAAPVMEAFEELVMEATRSQADEMVLALEDFYAADIKRANAVLSNPDVQKVLARLKAPITRKTAESWSGKEKEPSEALRILHRELDGGYRIARTEEGFVSIIDYEALRTFESRFSDEIQGYIELQAVQSASAAFTKDQLLISREELYIRLQAAEAYLDNFPNSVRWNEVEQLFTSYLRVYLFGLPKSQIYAAKDGRITPEAEAELTRLIAERPHSVAGRIVFEYMTLLRDTGGQLYIAAADGGKAMPHPLQSFVDRLEDRVAELFESGEPIPTEARVIFGDWAVTRVLGTTPNTAMSPEEQASWVGTQALYTDTRAVFGDEALDTPTYEPFAVTAEQFLQEYRVSIESLGWEGEGVSGVRVVNWNAPGSLLFLSGDSLVTLWDGVFFELEKVPLRK